MRGSSGVSNASRRLAWLVGSCLASQALAIPAHYSVSQLHHTQWTVRDGAPTGIEFMAQTRDGFLWLATAGGLFRFDGVEFERIREVSGVPLLSQNIFTLEATASGGLWIGYGYQGASYLHGDRLVNYDVDTGLPGGTIYAFADVPDGTVWAGTSQGLFRREGERWQQASTGWNHPADWIGQILFDRDGTLWSLAAGQTFYLRKGAEKFERLHADLKGIISSHTALDPDGVAMQCAHERYGLLKLKAPAEPGAFVADWDDRRGLPAGYARCAFDRDGFLWVATGEGLGRFRLAEETTGSSAGDLRRFRADLAPLAGEYITGLIEDLEGNIWVASSAGLDRFRAPALVNRPINPGLTHVSSMAAALDDGVWVSTLAGEVYHLRPNAVESFKLKELGDVGIETMHVTRSGEVWAGGGDAIWQLAPGGRWLGSRRLGAGNAPDLQSMFNIRAMTEDRAGAMWVSVRHAGIYRVTGKQWTLWRGQNDIPSQSSNASLTDDTGRIWFGFSDGEVAVLDGDRLTRFETDKQRRGAISAIEQQGEVIWVGSERGLWRIDGTSLSPLTGTGGPFAEVKGVVPHTDGDLWVGTSEDIVHIPAAELRRGLQDPRYGVRHDRLNYLDGLPAPVRTAARSGGKIWFATMNGVVSIDPAHIPRNRIVPAVILKSLVSDGVAHAFRGETPARLPANPRNLQVSYTAPSLTIPERVRFRYRLEGHETGWQDVGTRREAYFTDLAPGQYRFQVIAANNDGVWNETGATVAFVIPPTFVQSIWFTILCVIVGLVAMWLLYGARLRAVKSRMRLRMDERERIARELHDTFLQAVQGLMLRFQSAMERIPPHEPSRAMMEDALDRADRVIADGRDAVSNLRGASSTVDLRHGLEESGELLSRQTGMQFSFVEEGQQQELDPVASQEIHRIAMEALSNAFQHSQGSRVQLKIVHSSTTVLLEVSDDGRGFDPEGSPGGHFGLIGMRERAARLRARLRIDSGARGTTISIEIPAHIAYASTRRSGLLGKLTR